MTENCITVKDLTIGYKRHCVLSNINFSIKRGELAVIFGPNGSGKTTLFKTILRIIPPLHGTIIYGNSHYPKFGYVPQRQHLDEIYPFTAEEVVLMGTFGTVKPFSPTPGKNRILVEQCLRDVGMLEFKKQLFSELSGGQKQRILIARALATQPDVLLLDEPITGIDVHAQKKIIELISELHSKRQLTILMITHEVHHIPKWVNKIIHIHHYKVVLGSLEEIVALSRIDEIPNEGTDTYGTII
ncbi:MAG: metal ABC transporter ATP-binding protein [wastewater metagenome]|nr:metal ABC transporter ATP-binding protein [Candidatus Loosdrechtia aerotolerans]